MKILNWNVNLYIPNIKGEIQDLFKREFLILKTILNETPDIICLQESNQNLIDSLNKNNYILKGKTISHGGICCILCKSTLEITNIEINHSVGLVVTVENKKIATCHLAPYNNHSFRNVQLADFPSNLSIICGDFNDSDIGIKNLIKHTDNITWYLKFFKEGSNVCKKYDHVYSDKDIIIRSLKVYSYTSLSDHVPIVFEI